jgi:hypothetical protein
VKRSRAAGLCAILGAMTAAATGRADLAEDASRLASAWQRSGKVTRQKVRFVERGSPALIFSTLDAPAAKRAPCVTVAIIGPNSTHFVVRALGVMPLGASGDGSFASLAGLAQITRCGRLRSSLSALLLEMRSPRAVVETLVVESEKPPPQAVEILPQRDPGPIEPFSAVEIQATPAPLAARVELALARLRRDGGQGVTSEALAARPEGASSVVRTLSPGCHRLELLTEPSSSAGARTQLEVEPEVDAAARLVSTEPGDGLSSALTVCAAAESQLRLAYRGAPSSPVRLLAARWPLPDGLPEVWGALARAQVAAILFRHHAKVSGFPVDQGLGIQGPTLLPLRVEPGACYVAVVAGIAGRSAGFSLAASAPGVSAHNRSGEENDGTLVSFCARAGTEALLEADSRGYGVAWIYALFQTGKLAVGAELPR